MQPGVVFKCTSQQLFYILAHTLEIEKALEFLDTSDLVEAEKYKIKIPIFPPLNFLSLFFSYFSFLSNSSLWQISFRKLQIPPLVSQVAPD